MADRGDVPEAVLFDILLFLPVISLLRFKTVCKSWRSLIESCVFITQHLHHNSEHKKSLLMLKSEDKLSFLSGSKYQVHSNSTYEQIFLIFEIVNSCNGIVCLTHCISKDDILLSLWNPATKQVRQLPKPAVLPLWGKPDHTFAFGFDRKTNDYKIVRISLQRGVFSLKDSLVQVYSLRTDSWRAIHEGNDFPIAQIKPCVDVASNGEMFLWIGMSLSLRSTLIFYFDLANEVYGTAPLPDRHPDTHATNLAFLSGKITYIRCRGCCRTSSYYEIWMMEEFGKKESWNKVYKLEESILPCEGVSLIHLLNNGEFLLTMKHSGDDVGLYLYDLVAQEEMLLFNVRKVSSITNYTESLVSVNSTKLIM